MTSPMTSGSHPYTDPGFHAAEAGMGDPRLDGDTSRMPASDQSIGALIAEVADDVSRLVRQEVELAKAEVKTEARKAGKAAGIFGGAGFTGYLAAVFLCLTVMFALAAIMPIAWAALIVTVLLGAAAFVLYSIGRRQMRHVDPVPHQTVETLKEDAQWLRNPTR